jgi:hypothetical protein
MYSSSSLEQFIPQCLDPPWPELVNMYITHCRTRGHLDDNGLPELAVFSQALGRCNPHDRVHSASADFSRRVLCIERDWDHKPAAVVQVLEPARKRRKVNASRSKAAHDLMSGMF